MNYKEILGQGIFALTLATSSCSSSPPHENQQTVASPPPFSETDKANLLVDMQSYHNFMERLKDTRLTEASDRMFENYIRAYQSNQQAETDFNTVPWEEFCTGPAFKASTKEATGTLEWPTYGPIYTFFSAMHQGIDITPPYGTEVMAADGGVVVGRLQAWDYGNYLIINHGGERLTLYAHLSRMYPNFGDHILPGMVIGRVGSSGRATGPHLHFEVMEWGCKRVNPLTLLENPQERIPKIEIRGFPWESP